MRNVVVVVVVVMIIIIIIVVVNTDLRFLHYEIYSSKIYFWYKITCKLVEYVYL